jgi:hypothetical protein
MAKGDSRTLHHMKLWFLLMLLAVLGTAFSPFLNRQVKSRPRFTVSQRFPDLNALLSEVRVANESAVPLATVWFPFSGEGSPTPAVLEVFAKGANADLQPGESITSLHSEVRISGVKTRYVLFSCSSAELNRRARLRKRFPAFKILWSLPYYFIDLSRPSATPGPPTDRP